MRPAEYKAVSRLRRYSVGTWYTSGIWGSAPKAPTLKPLTVQTQSTQLVSVKYTQPQRLTTARDLNHNDNLCHFKCNETMSYEYNKNCNKILYNNPA